MTHYNSQQGNIILYVLLGIVLVGLLTVAIRNSGGMRSDIDAEDMVLKAGQVQRHANEVAQAVSMMISDRVSEADLRFALPDDNTTEYGDIATTPEYQIFSPQGGKVTYRQPPEGAQVTAAPWEFFATTAIPQMGSDKAELIAVLPDVKEELCTQINKQVGQVVTAVPADLSTGTTPDCVMGANSDRFVGVFKDVSPNVLDDTTFDPLPAAQACVQCSDSTYNYYYVLMSR